MAEEDIQAFLSFAWTHALALTAQGVVHSWGTNFTFALALPSLASRLTRLLEAPQADPRAESVPPAAE